MSANKEHNQYFPIRGGETKPRNSNIELLRIICILSVVLLHFCNNIPDALGITAESSATNYLFVRFFYSFAIVAVDVFFIISGFFMCTSTNVKIGKIVNLLALTCGYRLLLYMPSVVLHPEIFSVKELLWQMLPKSYFVLMYISIYCLSPWINRAISNLPKKQYARLLMVSMILFCIWNTVINLLGNLTPKSMTELFTVTLTTSDRGFSIINFLMMYLWGGYIRQFGLLRNSKVIAAAITLGCMAASALMIYYFPSLDVLINYDSPLVILQSLSFFVFFNNLHIQSKTINFISKSNMGIYLLHGMFLSYIKDFLPISCWLKGNVVICCLTLMLTVFAAYALSAICDISRRAISYPISKYWLKSKIANLSLWTEK